MLEITFTYETGHESFQISILAGHNYTNNAMTQSIDIYVNEQKNLVG